MNIEELGIWKNAVKENCDYLKTIADDRVLLKEKFIKHIDEFFEDYVEIKFSQNLDVITVKWDWRDSPKVKNGNLNELGMDWEIGLDEKSILIRLFPFGEIEE